jgi:hypothetical protein
MGPIKNSGFLVVLKNSNRDGIESIVFSMKTNLYSDYKNERHK